MHKGRTLVFGLGTHTRKPRPLQTFYYPEPPIIKPLAAKGKGRSQRNEQDRFRGPYRGRLVRRSHKYRLLPHRSPNKESS
jgi:hypothetical protein